MWGVLLCKVLTKEKGHFFNEENDQKLCVCIVCVCVCRSVSINIYCNIEVVKEPEDNLLTNHP